MSMATHFFGDGKPGVAHLAHGVAGRGDGLAEHDLADVDRDVGAGVDQLGDGAGAAGEAGLALLAVAVELQVGEVDPAAFHAFDGGERRGVAAGDAQIAAVDVDRVRDAERGHGVGQRGQDGARGDLVERALLVEVEPAAVELEGADPAGVDDLDRQRLRGVQRPGDVVAGWRPGRRRP